MEYSGNKNGMGKKDSLYRLLSVNMAVVILSLTVLWADTLETAASAGTDDTYSAPTVSVAETETTAARDSSKHANIRDTVNSRTDTIRNKNRNSNTSAVTGSASASGNGRTASAGKGTGVTSDVQIYPEKYDMNLILDTAAKKLTGTVTVRIRNNTDGKLTMFCIRNYAASVLAQNGGKAADAVISMVTTKTGIKLQLNTARDPSVVYVSLGEYGIDPSETGSFIISFSEKIPKLDDRFGYHQNSDGGLMFQLSYCFPVLAMYDNGKWDENPYFYAGEVAYSPCTDYTAVLNVPKDYVVASTGETVKNGDSVRINAKDVRDVAVTACNFMREDNAAVDGKKINLFYFTGTDSSRFRKYVMGAAEDALSMFTEQIGDYAYDELDVVEAYLPGGMEYPGLVLIDTDMGDKNTSYSDLCELTAHEVAHQWFYASVGNDQYREAWLDEGFATYLEQSVYANSGSATLAEAVKYDRSKGVTPVQTWSDQGKYASYMKQKTDGMGDRYYVNQPYSAYKSDASYTSHVYDGGGAFLYELKQTMGTSVFNRALRDYYAKYRSDIACTQDFLAVIHSADPSGKTQSVIDRFISE